MYRAGSTLQYNLTSALLRHHGLGDSVGFLDEGYAGSLTERFGIPQGILVVKAHRITPEIKNLLFRGEALSIGVYRDIRDVVVSLKDFLGVDFAWVKSEGWLEKCVEGLSEWEDCPGHLSSRYDHLIEDPALEVLRIAAHLNLVCDWPLANGIAKEYTAEKQLARMDGIREQMMRLGVSGMYSDPETELHPNHIFDGQNQKWVGRLNQEEVTYIEERYAGWLLNRGYPLAAFFAETKSEPGISSFQSIEEERKSLNQTIDQLKFHSAAKDEWIATLEETVKKKDDWIQAVTSDGESKSIIISQLVEEQENNILRISQLESDAINKDNRIRAQSKDIENLSAVVNEIQTILNQMISSTSWRLTAPLRWIRSLFARK